VGYLSLELITLSPQPTALSITASTSASNIAKSELLFYLRFTAV